MKNSGAISGTALAEISNSVGQEVGLSDWFTVDQERIDAFGYCTEDTQWIHTDPQRAERESPYKSTIAHGYLVLSLLTHLQSSAGAWPRDAAAILNYGIEKVRFIQPIHSGSRIRNRAVLAAAQYRADGNWRIDLENTVEIEGSAKPAMVATSLLMMVPVQ